MQDGSYTRMFAPEIEVIVEEHNQRVYAGEMPVENKQQLRKRIKNLLIHAKPGNVPWQILQTEFGFTGDYVEADNGTHWSDSR
jgi:hypothetical protein